MPLSCSCGDYDGEGWYYFPPEDYTTLATKRGRKCCSCRARIAIGSVCAKFIRERGPENDIEERIYGDEVPLAAWYMCERCADLYFSLAELGFCVSPDDSMQDLIKEYAEEYGPSNKTEVRQARA